MTPFFVIPLSGPLSQFYPIYLLLPLLPKPSKKKKTKTKKAKQKQQQQQEQKNWKIFKVEKQFSLTSLYQHNSICISTIKPII